MGDNENDVFEGNDDSGPKEKMGVIGGAMPRVGDYGFGRIHRMGG